MKHEMRISCAGTSAQRNYFAMGMLAAVLCGPLAATSIAAEAKTGRKVAAAPPLPQQVATAQTASPSDEPAEIGPGMVLTIGKSTLMRLPTAIDRISVGNPNVADVTLISGRELYLLGKTVGATNVMLWRRGGSTLIIDVAVNIDAARLQDRIHELMPAEKSIKVSTAADSVVLSGEVSSAVAAEQVLQIAEAYVRNLNRGMILPVLAGGGQAAPGSTITVGESRGAAGAVTSSQVVNMLRIASPQQVMLEVKVAEVSKTLLDKLGANVSLSRANGSWTYAIISSLLSGGSGVLSATQSANKLVKIDAEKKDGLVRILAEPNIIAISGQEGSFLAGGKIFIPVSNPSAANGTPTLEEREFGVGLKFTPTVLEGGRINLRVAPEVSELSQTGSPFTTINGTTAILPSFTTRRAQTTVQLNDGQSFAIAGLIKNNVTETVKRFPVLGEIPILGALFRSSEFQRDQTELMFIVTPRLVKPLPPNHAVPGDAFVPPTRSEFFLEGKLEGGATKAPAPKDTAPKDTAPATAPRALPPPAKGGFENQ
jgi:pilus assembly protein CpaC